VPVLVCRYPVGGHVVPAPIELAGAPWKSSLIYAAGPAAEFLVVVLMAMSVGLDQLLGKPESFAVLSAQAISVAALLGVVFNLIPIVTAEGAMTDGLGILTSPWLPREAFESRLALPYTTQAESLLLAGRREAAISVLAEGVSSVSDNVAARVRLAEGLLDADEGQKVVEVLGALIERDDVPAGLQPSILSTLSLALLRTAPERLDDADEYTQFALTQAPDSTTAKLARSRVLIELGRLHPASSLLQELGLEMADERWVDTRDVYLALIEQRRGRVDAAVQIVNRLLERGARGPELRLLLEELGPAHNA
jgi:tetratricopeptide (TPR) repeat protein